MASYTVTESNFKSDATMSASVGDTVTINATGSGYIMYGVNNTVSVPGCTYNIYGTSKYGIYTLSGTVTTAGTYKIPIRYVSIAAKDSGYYITLTVTNPSYTVTFNANGGSSTPSAQTKTKGTVISLPSAGTKTGYTFNGWYTASSGGTYVGTTGSNYTVNSNVTLYAQWSQITYTVTYNGNGGTSSSASATVTYGNSTTLPTATRIGHTLKGWYTASSGGTLAGVAGASYTPTATITLYAQWDVLTSVNVSGSWKPATPYVNVSGTWKEVVGVYVNVNGTWKKTK